ncbi:MAG TPA: cytochrome c oxidase subunit 3 family protein [Candidatus Acidoferrales bacterium]|nr:cytochrome c oxidase subunit 3 family protein [Candidatus Acidoferrales bacterium]
MHDIAAHSDAHARRADGLVHQFVEIDQQRDAGRLGMWLFLATEILFFGGMFTAYTVYRSLHYQAFVDGSHELIVKFGATNTAVLICSSLTMALAIRSAQTGKRKSAIIGWLVATMLLGIAFIAIKLYFEWYHDWLEGLVPGLHWFSLPGHPPHTPGMEQFFCFYFFMTGLHALHMVVGVGILTVLVIMTARNRFSSQYYAPLEISGLYWHFVDIVWIFLFPLLYLIGGRYPGS